MPEPLYDYVTVPSLQRSNFDLSFAKYLTTDFFRLVPVAVKECVPGDIWSIGNRIVLRFQPMFAPVLADITVRTHYFFVPYRLLWGRQLDAPPGYTIGMSDPHIGFNAYHIPDTYDGGGAPLSIGASQGWQPACNGGERPAGITAQRYALRP